MDNYTSDTKNWLDDRFRATDEAGIYIAHQPIYGFRKGHSESGTILRYIITYQIMKALSHLKFTSLLDVGGAEGYKVALVRSIFNVDVRSADLSAEACKRAKEIFSVDGEPIDIHNLPYKDNEFDVVLCSETLEHVSDIQRATKELIRVCKKAVVITVPHEPKEVVEYNIKNKIPHAHIHCLDTRSFDFALPMVSKIISRKFHNSIMKKIAALAEGMKREQIGNHKGFFVKMYNRFIPLLRLFWGMRSVRMLMTCDDYISNKFSSYSGMVFVLLKDADSYSEQSCTQISVPQIMEFKVPYYYIKTN